MLIRRDEGLDADLTLIQAYGFSAGLRKIGGRVRRYNEGKTASMLCCLLTFPQTVTSG